MKKHELFMRRCFDLARLGSGTASPNPIVGACLVYDNKIIGEGYHKQYGGAHAEVNAFTSVPPSKQKLIRDATLYVSLEPCCIFGNTPPCTELILQHSVSEIVISCLDQTPKVAGNGVKVLKEAGCKVIVGVLEEEGKLLSRTRNIFVTQQRPYIILKYAQSIDGYIGHPDKQIWLTNKFSKKLVHKWRSEIDAILVGTQTAILDNPMLNNRYYYGHTPLRIVLDKSLKIPVSHHLLNDQSPTLVITAQQPPNVNYDQTEFLQLTFDESLIEKLMSVLFKKKVGILMVEGGARTLESFINSGLWDEARVFTTEQLLKEGIKTPKLLSSPLETYSLGSDSLGVFRNNSSMV